MKNALATATFFSRFSIGNLKLLLKKGISADWAYVSLMQGLMSLLKVTKIPKVISFSKKER